MKHKRCQFNALGIFQRAERCGRALRASLNCGALAAAAAACILLLCHALQVQGQSLGSLLQNAPTATAPAGNIAPKPLKQPPLVAAGQGSPDRRQGRVMLTDGRIYTGTIYTTVGTPFRLWHASIKRYQDVSIALVKRIRTIVASSRDQRQWRYLQDGSDLKVYSGKTYARIQFLYRFTLLNGRHTTGSLVAPLYIDSHGKKYFFLLMKHFQSKLGEKAANVVFVKDIRLKVTPQVLAAYKKMTRKLPLTDYRDNPAPIHLAPAPP